ncbi:MAG: hypothetical protein HY815_17275 [Candidatus Riflebacteria bacterium]|nr:hypothetical protein [Candidatus Riflebacteria bacterium]
MTLTGFRFMGSADNPRDAVGMLELPIPLSRMTSLPTTVPARVHYSTPPAGVKAVPIRFEVLGISTFSVGGNGVTTDNRSRHCRILAPPGPANDAMPIWIDAKNGKIIGRGRADLPALRGLDVANGKPRGDEATIANRPVTFLYDPARNQRVNLSTSGSVSCTGPAFQLIVAVSSDPKVTLFCTWADAREYQKTGDPGRLAPMPLEFPDPQVLEVAPGVLRTRTFWAEYDAPIDNALRLGVSTSFAARTVQATARTTDGIDLSAVDVTGVVTASLPLVPKVPDISLPLVNQKIPLAGKDVIPPIPVVYVSRSSPGSLRFFRQGLVELSHQDSPTIQVWGGKVQFVLSNRADVRFDVIFRPSPIYTVDDDGLRFGLAPRITLRHQNLDSGGDFTLEDAFVTVGIRPEVLAEIDWNVFIPDTLPKFSAELAVLTAAGLGTAAYNADGKTQIGLSAGAGAALLLAMNPRLLGQAKSWFSTHTHLDKFTLDVGMSLVGRIGSSDRLTIYGKDVWVSKRSDRPVPGTTSTTKEMPPLSEDVTKEAGIAYEHFSGDSPVQLSARFKYRRGGKLGRDETRRLEIDGEYQLPSGWLWASNRTATGQWILTNQKLGGDPGQPDLRTNRREFRATDLISLSSADLDAPDFSEAINFDLSELSCMSSAAEQKVPTGSVKVVRTQKFAVQAFGGVVSSGPSSGSTFQVLLDAMWDRKSEQPPGGGQAPPTPAQAPSTGFFSQLLRLFSNDGPSLPDWTGSAQQQRLAVNLSFVGAGNDRVRLNSVSGLVVASGPRVFSAELGVRTTSGPQWGTICGYVEKSPRGWEGGADVKELPLGSKVSVRSAYFRVKPPAPARKLPFYRRVAVGGLFGIDPNGSETFTDAGVNVGFDVDLEDKGGSLFLNLPGSLFGSDRLKAAGATGALAFSESWSLKHIELEVYSKFCPPWSSRDVDGKPYCDKLMEVAASFRGEGAPSVFAARVSGISTAPLYDDGMIIFDHVGIGYDRFVKMLTYDGGVEIKMPSMFVKSFKPFLQTPAKISGRLIGASKVGGDSGDRKNNVTVLATLDPYLQIGISDYASIRLETLQFRKGSPFALDSSAVLQTGSTTTPLSLAFDAASSAMSFAVTDPNKVVELGMGGLSLSIRNFGARLASVNGVGHFTISGDAQVTVFGRRFSGTLAGDVGKDGSLSFAISRLGGSDGGIGGDLEGFKVACEALSITSARTGSGGRSTQTSVSASLSFPPGWPGIGGQTVKGSIEFGTGGDFGFSVETGLDLGLSGIPVELDIHQFMVRRQSGKFSVEGSATLKLLRPINTILGNTGDNPVSFDCDIGLTTDKKVKFAAKLNQDMLDIPFDIVIASGRLKCKSIAVSTGPDLVLDIELRLSSPASFLMTISALLRGQRVSFSIVCDPPLQVRVPLLDFGLANLTYDQVFPGFMGFGGTGHFKVGYDDIFAFTTSLENLLYILPSSLPPFGFPFFDELSLGLKLFGFGGVIGLRMRAPQIPDTATAIKFVLNVITGFKDNDWGPLEDFLRGEAADKIKQLFPSPGIGDIALGIRRELRPIFPNLPLAKLQPTDSDDSLKLSILSGFKELTDLIPSSDLADGVVQTLKFCGNVGRVFQDPKNVVELIPRSLRTGSMDFSFVGSTAIAGSYSIQPREDIKMSGNAPLLPSFYDLSKVCEWLATGVTPVRAVVSGRAGLVTTSFAFGDSAGTSFGGTVKDRWTPLRLDVDRALELMNKAARPDRLFEPDDALAFHLQGAVAAGGVFLPCGKALLTKDGKSSLTLTGYTPPFTVTRAGQTLFDGKVQLMRTITQTVPGGRLNLYSTVVQEGSARMTSVVTAEFVPDDAAMKRYQADFSVWNAKKTAFVQWSQKSRRWDQKRQKAQETGQSLSADDPDNPGPMPESPGDEPKPPDTAPVSLGEVVRAPVFDLATGRGSRDFRSASVADWQFVYYLDDTGDTQATFTSYGSMKFTAPGTVFTALYKGSLLPDMRRMFQRVEPFKEATFATDCSSFALGQTVWSALFNSPAFSPDVDHVEVDRRQVTVFLRSGDLMKFRLDDVGYYLTPPAGDATTQKSATIDAAADLDSFEMKDKLLVARPFAVHVKGAGESRSADRVQVNDLVVFDGSEDMARFLARCKEQKVKLEQTDLKKFESLGLTPRGDPLVVRSLTIGAASGMVELDLRPLEIQVVRRADSMPLFSITTTTVDAFDIAKRGGPFGDPVPYPPGPGLFYVSSSTVMSASGIPPGMPSTGPVAIASNRIDLNAVLGTDVLVREVRIDSPAGIAGRYSVVGPSYLSGTTGQGGLTVTGDPTLGMSAEVPGSPGPVKLLAGPTGGASGKIWAYNGLWPIEVVREAGRLTGKFSFCPGTFSEGGLMASLRLGLAPAQTGFEASISGAIGFDGRFHFEGQAMLTVFGRDIADARFVLDSSDGLIVHGRMDVYIARSDVDIRVSSSGASVYGDLGVGYGGTGFYGVISAQVPGDTDVHTRGQLRIAGRGLTSGEFTITRDGTISTGWSLSAGVASIGATLTFKFIDGVRVRGEFDASVNVYIGSFSYGWGADISSSGDVSVEFYPITLTFNVCSGSVSVDIANAAVEAFNKAKKALEEAARKVASWFSSWF